MVGRAVKEWIGKTPDSKVPPHVRARIFEDHDGSCYLTGRKIMPGEPWELEHVKPLSEGGEHRERNLRPALVEPHKAKSAKEATRRGKANRAKLAHIGAAEPTRNPIKSRGFPPSDKPAPKITKPRLEPRALFVEDTTR